MALVENLIDAELDQVAPMILAGHLNVAACYLKLGEYKECINACDKVNLVKTFWNNQISCVVRACSLGTIRE